MDLFSFAVKLNIVYSKALILFTFYFISLTSATEENCTNINVHGVIKNSVENIGNHRSFQCSLTVQKQDQETFPNFLSDGIVLIKQVYPAGLFVDPYQLESLENSTRKYYVHSEVNVEAPEFHSKAFELSIMSYLENGHMVINYPFHLRYHRPKYCYSQGGYHNISLQKVKSVIVADRQYCKLKRNEIICTQGPDTCMLLKLNITEIGEKYVEISVGCIEHYWTVLTITSIITIGGCLWLARTIFNLKKNGVF